METLLGKLFLDLLLKLGSGLALSEIGCDLIHGVQTHSTTFTYYISSSEVKLINLSILLYLRDPLGYVLLNLAIVFLSLNL